MIKAMRKTMAETGRPERFRIITFEGAFHGRTLATLAATGNAKYLDGFGPKVDGFDQVPFGNMNAVRDAIGPATAGILIEPVQGEGGVRPAELRFLRDLRATCDEFGLLLGLDEVQIGMGRSGRLWAHQWAGIEPDVMSSAKGIGGGFRSARSWPRSMWRSISSPARTAPPTAATRSPAPPATRCWT